MNKLTNCGKPNPLINYVRFTVASHMRVRYKFWPSIDRYRYTCTVQYLMFT